MNRSFLSWGLLIFLVGAPAVSFARMRHFTEEDAENRMGLKIPLKVGLDLDSGSALGSNLRPSLAVGAGLELYLHPVFGMFVGADYVSRGYSFTSGSASTATFVDIPFGVAFQYGTFGGNGVGTFKIGGFYALPTNSTFSGGTVFGTLNTQGFFGIEIEAGSVFPVTDGFGLGFTTWAKYGLGSAVTQLNSLFADFGFGLAARFL